ncbi:hypothetical protein [Roseibium alexandrii]|uniref:Uncharacterized protein n=1 Tax=Roseibium alexandrii (strain DSM 17067 / NCIMB 14079 / DFL-11) TaxID=244592 RepID=A0A5E8H084_ROSAD|nr:hypothetical protein [Roseibium alexandrii]EEE45801.1 hypothetical protein SADFL11_3090 [Roseibium alexandrii DFL-11]
MKWLIIAGTTLVVGWSSQTLAWSDSERYKVASHLGSVLGSEAACGITIKQAAISAYIEEAVPADDIEFTSDLNSNTDLMRYELEEMPETQKNAHCVQIRRVSKAFGFID